jgi:hypothetical protein
MTERTVEQPQMMAVRVERVRGEVPGRNKHRNGEREVARDSTSTETLSFRLHTAGDSRGVIATDMR